MGGGRGVRVLLACIIICARLDEQIHVTNKVLSGEYVAYILTSSRDIPRVCNSAYPRIERKSWTDDDVAR